MVSLDTPEKNRAFADALEASHVLLSDPDGDAARAYGVLALGGLSARRWTYYTDAAGVIRAIDPEVETGTAGQDIARTLEALGFPKRDAGRED